MFKLKKHYKKVDSSHWWRGAGYFGYENSWNWFRYPKGRRQWVSLREIDLLDEDSRGCTIRAKDPYVYPDCYEDRPFSRGRLKSWKDVSRKRKQWE